MPRVYKNPNVASKKERTFSCKNVSKRSRAFDPGSLQFSHNSLLIQNSHRTTEENKIVKT